MFADCFVPDHVAVALRSAGFNEPCMALHEYYGQDGKVYSKHIVNYSNVPPDPDLYNDLIKEVIREHPGIIIRGEKKNSELPQFLYAAPLYQQVLAWLFARGLRIHTCYIAQEVYNKGNNGAWVYMIYDTKWGKALYPLMGGYKEFATQRDTWNDAILKALKLLSNDKMDV